MVCISFREVWLREEGQLKLEYFEFAVFIEELK